MYCFDACILTFLFKKWSCAAEILICAKLLGMLYSVITAQQTINLWWMETMFPIQASFPHRELAIQFHLEAGHLSYFYYEASQASDHMTKAESLSGLQVKLTGQSLLRSILVITEWPQLLTNNALWLLIATLGMGSNALCQIVEIVFILTNDYASGPLKNIPGHWAINTSQTTVTCCTFT